MDKILFDAKLMKVGCVILQSFCGGDRKLCNELSDHWLTSMTPDMKVYNITEEQKPILIRKVREFHQRSSSATNVSTRS